MKKSYYNMNTEEFVPILDAFAKRIPNATKWIANFKDNKLEVYFDNVHKKEFILSKILNTLD